MSKRILIALTSHDHLGDTGQPTGAYLPELAHPHAIFVAAGHRAEQVGDHHEAPRGSCRPRRISARTTSSPR